MLQSIALMLLLGMGTRVAVQKSKVAWTGRYDCHRYDSGSVWTGLAGFIYS